MAGKLRSRIEGARLIALSSSSLLRMGGPNRLLAKHRLWITSSSPTREICSWIHRLILRWWRRRRYQRKQVTKWSRLTSKTCLRSALIKCRLSRSKCRPHQAPSHSFPLNSHRHKLNNSSLKCSLLWFNRTHSGSSLRPLPTRRLHLLISSHHHSTNRNGRVSKLRRCLKISRRWLHSINRLLSKSLATVISISHKQWRCVKIS